MRPAPTLAALLALAACAELERPQPAAKVPPVPPGSTEPIRFDDLRLVEMRRGDEVGRYVFGLDCVPPYDTLFWTTGRNLREQGTYEARFREAMAEAGFDVAGAGGGLLDRETDRKRARFTVSGELRDVRMELCRREHWFTGASQGESGVGTARVDWSVHRAGDGRLVHRATTTGSAALDHGVPQGRFLLVEEAFLDAALKLAADPAFRNTVARPGAAFGGQQGAPPAPRPAGAPVPLQPAAAEPAAMSADVPLLLVASPPARSGPSDPDAVLTRAIVEVGSGRGVVVGEAAGLGALVLAKAAAVGADGVAAVRPAPGVSLDGVVERRDTVQGLVLLRVPARLTGIPLRAEAPEVSEAVRAVLRGGEGQAVGIVARLAAAPDGTGEEGLADLAGARVADGDPLLDGAGRMIGLVIAPPPHAAPARTGLTPFIPVGGALERMGLALRPGEGGAGRAIRIDRPAPPPT